tara:strand:- start:1502 stop:2104 length:603 start_codon:yes stop_codon:yes gene_type:complete
MEDVDTLVVQELMYSIRVNNSIKQHLNDLRDYAVGCDRIIEIGNANLCATIALILSNPKFLKTIDINDVLPEFMFRVDLLGKYAKKYDMEFEYVINDSIQEEPVECDLLFIDSFHHYAHLKAELNLYKDCVSRHIVLHDTHSYANRNEYFIYVQDGGIDYNTEKAGLSLAVDEFLKENPMWSVDRIEEKNNGMTYLKREG